MKIIDIYLIKEKLCYSVYNQAFSKDEMVKQVHKYLHNNMMIESHCRVFFVFISTRIVFP